METIKSESAEIMPKWSRRDILINGLQAGVGILISSAMPLHAQKKLREVSLQDYVVIGSYIEENPDNYRKRCHMVNDTNVCDGSESINPFEAKNFAIRVYKVNSEFNNPNIPIFLIIKRDKTIEITLYTWTGEESGKSTLQKDDTNKRFLLYLLNVVKKVKNK